MRLARTAAPLPRSEESRGRSRTCALRLPKPAGCPSPLRRVVSTPGGTRTRSFRVEGPASSPIRPRGQEGSGGRVRTCPSRLTVARLTDSTTPERGGASTSGRRGSRTAKARTPTRFRDGVRRQWQSFQYSPQGLTRVHGPGRRRTCTHPIKSRGLCPLSYGAEGVAGRDRTCGAPRFKRALYRLSYGHTMGEAGVEPAASGL
jgi:hypothetical protein